MTYNNNERNYYHFKIDFYNQDNTEILKTKYYLTSHDIRKELIMSEKTIYTHVYKGPLFKGRKYRNLHIQRVREPVIKHIAEILDHTRILLNIVKDGYDEINNLKNNNT